MKKIPAVLYNLSGNLPVKLPLKLPVKVLSSLMASMLITSCSTMTNIVAGEDVKPWQKDVLAQKAMQFPQDEMFLYSDDHIFFSKEASTGGNSVGGGGCGCN